MTRETPIPFGPEVEGEMILVAEDQQLVRAAMVRMLRKEGFTVIEAEDGEDAIERFRQNSDKIRLVLLDVVMPKLHGREVLEVISALRPDVHVVFCTGYAPEAAEIDSLPTDGITIIAKPFTRSALIEAVKNTMAAAK
jgi:CheY-like chemotaxis protein